MRYKSAQGQILVLVLLVVLVGLTVGLSIASRTLSNLRNSSDLDQSNRAFSAAEAGIEKALAAIGSNASCDNNACAPTLSGIDAVKVDVTQAGGGTSGFGIPNLAQDDVIQVNLQGYTGSSLNTYWGTTGDAGSGQNSSAAIVVSVVYSTSGNYGLGKVAVDDFAASRNNNFVSTVTVDPTIPGGLTIQDGSNHNNYGFQYAINLTDSTKPNMLIPAGATPVLARIRLMYAGPKQIAFAPVGTTLPKQGQQITSTASAGGKTRTVKVFKSNATLPAIFDYALFNGSTSPLTK